MIKTFSDIAEKIRELQTQLEAHAEEHDGDITSFPLLEHLDELQKAQEGRAAEEHLLCSLACMALEYYDEAEAMKAQAKRIQEAAAKVEAKAAGIEKYITGRMQPEDKIKDDRVKLSIRKSQAIEIDDATTATDLPLEYQKITVSADKVALTKAIKAGAEVPGVTLITRLNLQIK